MNKEPIQNEKGHTRIHIRVTGHVQGVGYRVYVLHIGNSLGLSGWVRNVGYNIVETIAEGPPGLVERFIESVKNGPRSARVEESNLEWEPATGEFKLFEVR